MITKDNLCGLLLDMGYGEGDTGVYEKKYPDFDCSITVDYNKELIIYPEEKGFQVNDRTTSNFDENENFVVLECVDRLLTKGYRPEHIELERRWKLGHSRKSGKADIYVTDSEGKKCLFIIECKTYGDEYRKELKNIDIDGGQLFSYFAQARSAQWLILYASNFTDKRSYITESICSKDDKNDELLAKKDESIKLYKDASEASDLFDVWCETYGKRYTGDIVFNDNTKPYDIGIKPLTKNRLRDFEEGDKIVNKFEEILRHNNVSDKENAFNRLVALFICKLVDEEEKEDNDIVDFQYKIGTDTYETLQERLQKLHQKGMEKYMKEEIVYIPDEYAEKLIMGYTGQKRTNMINDLKKTIKMLKFYTNNDFAFKDVHNEELFLQNGKILVEVVQLFQEYRIVGSEKLQLLGDLFENLLTKGFKQNEGQFFTPIPITRFIWNAIPTSEIINIDRNNLLPKVIDYACGAGHFLTEGYSRIKNGLIECAPEMLECENWEEKVLFGVEKDYRLARVSKIELFMHGAGNGNIVFGDGLEEHEDKGVVSNTFDILVANPPYSVEAFKPHLKVKDDEFKILKYISNDGSEIETLFVERISQLLKPNAVAAVILPDSIVRKDMYSFRAAREILLQNFEFKAIVRMESSTFGKTGQPTAIMFLKKRDEPPKQFEMVQDIVEAVFSRRELEDWEDKDIFESYLKRIDCTENNYYKVIQESVSWEALLEIDSFAEYVMAFMEEPMYRDMNEKYNDGKMEPDEFEEWRLKTIYDRIHDSEREKLMYFALTCKQHTLFVSMPSDTKEQEMFLGYKWCDRKKMEGILETNDGLLFSKRKLNEDGYLASMIWRTFDGIEYIAPKLKQYSFFANMSDMLDFDEAKFSKVIKLSMPRKRVLKPGYKKYKLINKKIFETGIGRRVLKSELTEGKGINIYSANVCSVFGKIDKEILDDYSRPSILWGIDGDWMVNIIDANKKFYPTDHCGYIRILIDDIIPEFLAMALEVEGKLEKFSRANRASTDRIRKISIFVPEDINEQKRILNEINSEKSKKKKEELIRKYFIE
ncbi:N-6 DNA methylase [Clostridium fessum]|uniref:N-6 DNA methylase n=1 Tax=Clostridium fessum TaxID=2126740 RepID=UPI0022E62617|nr:N-6 DNA methylase [Clostridium fessum]